MRLTDILLEPVSNLMGLIAESAKLDAAARRVEARALLLSTRRLPVTGVRVGQIDGALIEALRGSVRLEAAVGAAARRRGVRPTEAFSELAYSA